MFRLDPLAEIVYRFICAYMADNGYAPTLREIGAECKMSRSSVVRYLDQLEMKGLIRRDFGVSRGIVLLSDAED
jgi:DNA-binding MarR family transcriptional regulator